MPETTARMVATPHTSPVITALSKYHNEKGQYPESLDALQPNYLKGNLKDYTERITDAGQRWVIDYKFIDSQNYELSFNHAHYNVYYKNGIVVRAFRNLFR